MISRLMILLLLLVTLTIVKATNVHYCKDNADYEVKVKDVVISPNPIVRGEPVTFTISAHTGRGISSGKIAIEVSYFGWHVYSETNDLCNETTCPVKIGDFLITNSQVIPGFTPSGTYALKMKMLDAQKEELTCITFSFNIGEKPSLANI